MKYILTCLVLINICLPVTASLPEYWELPASQVPFVTDGSVKAYIVKSSPLDDEITVAVWTPDGYYTSADISYPVIYAHDGQNLFDPTFSFAGVAWELDDSTQKLIADNQITAPIIVGIYNRGNKQLRANDYFPEKALNYIPESERDDTYIWETCEKGFFGDEQAEFVVTELKPLVDNLYRTNPDRDHTFALGSSMGGLASLYLMCEYPDVFGGVACLSTHWIGSLKLDTNYNMSDDPVCANAILAYLNANLPSPDSHRLYLDMGTMGWDADNLKYESAARETAIDRGYSAKGGTLYTYDATGAGHNEYFWQIRITIPLSFLLSKAYPNDIPCIVDEDEKRNGVWIGMNGATYTHPPRAGIYIRRTGMKYIKTSLHI